MNRWNEVMFSAMVAILQFPVTSLRTFDTTKEISSLDVLLSCFSSVCCSVELIASFVSSLTLSFVPDFPKIAARITTIITQNHHFLKIGFLTLLLKCRTTHWIITKNISRVMMKSMQSSTSIIRQQQKSLLWVTC